MNIVKTYKDYNQLYKSLYNLNNTNIRRYKFIEEDDIVLIKLQLNFNSENVEDIYRSSYLFIISKIEYKLLYSYYDKVYFNEDGASDLFFFKMKNDNLKVTELLDGINIFMFYTDKWITINDYKSNTKKLLKNTVLSKINILLNKKYKYHFTLLDSNYKNIIDYSDRFGDNYKKIYHISTKLDNKLESIENKPFSNIGIEYLLEQKNFNLVDNNNLKKSVPNSRGLSIIINKGDQLINYMIENESYKFFNLLKPDENKYETFIRLYHLNLLEIHLSFYENNKYITNKKNVNEKFKIIDVINGCYELLSKELYELFIKVWNLEDSSHRDKKLYNFLPTEYKVVLYRIKGVYFKNRQKNHRPYLTYENIRVHITKIEYKIIIKLLISRRKVKQNMENNITDDISISFQQIYSKLDREKLKMMAILTNYLCPTNEKKYKTIEV